MRIYCIQVSAIWRHKSILWRLYTKIKAYLFAPVNGKSQATTCVPDNPTNGMSASSGSSNNTPISSSDGSVGNPNICMILAGSTGSVGFSWVICTPVVTGCLGPSLKASAI